MGGLALSLPSVVNGVWLVQLASMAFGTTVLVEWDALFAGALVTEITAATKILVGPALAVFGFFVLGALVC